MSSRTVKQYPNIFRLPLMLIAAGSAIAIVLLVTEPATAFFTSGRGHTLVHLELSQGDFLSAAEVVAAIVLTAAITDFLRKEAKGTVKERREYLLGLSVLPLLASLGSAIVLNTMGLLYVFAALKMSSAAGTKFDISGVLLAVAVCVSVSIFASLRLAAKLPSRARRLKERRKWLRDEIDRLGAARDWLSVSYPSSRSAYSKGRLPFLFLCALSPAFAYLAGEPADLGLRESVIGFVSVFVVAAISLVVPAVGGVMYREGLVRDVDLPRWLIALSAWYIVILIYIALWLLISSSPWLDSSGTFWAAVATVACSAVSAASSLRQWSLSPVKSSALGMFPSAPRLVMWRLARRQRAYAAKRADIKTTLELERQMQPVSLRG